MSFIQKKVFEGDSSLGKLSAEIYWSISISNHNLVEYVFTKPLLQRREHVFIIKALQFNKRNTLDLLIAIKSFVSSNRMTTGLLVQENIIPVLFSLMILYREAEQQGSVLSPAGDFINVPKLNLSLEIVRLILESGFSRSNDDNNLYSEIILGLNIDRFKNFLDMVCDDRLVIMRSLKSPFIAFLTEKNVLENITLLCSNMKRIFAFSRQDDKVVNIEYLEGTGLWLIQRTFQKSSTRFRQA